MLLLKARSPFEFAQIMTVRKSERMADYFQNLPLISITLREDIFNHFLYHHQNFL